MEIVETHHRLRRTPPRDGGPSADAVATAWWTMEMGVRVVGDDGSGPGEIGSSRPRGDVAGRAHAYLRRIGERFEITHRAHSRDTFARGAWCAAWVLGKPPGFTTWWTSWGSGRGRSRGSGDGPDIGGHALADRRENLECPPARKGASSHCPRSWPLSDQLREGASGGSATPSTVSPAQWNASPSPDVRERAVGGRNEPWFAVTLAVRASTGRSPWGAARARGSGAAGGGPPWRRRWGPGRGRRHPPSGDP